MKKILLLVVFLGGLTSCGVEPAPIKYGEDACDFCQMTIVSPAFAAQAVSDKGKQFKYDAIECMIHDEQKNKMPKAIRQVANLHAPGEMIPVEKAVFVINDTINSPMGANLGALPHIHDSGKWADVFTWDEVIRVLIEEDLISLN